jgi:hypothetical protein
MDPTTVFCPNPRCHARGQTGQDNIGIHSQKEQRFMRYVRGTCKNRSQGVIGLKNNRLQ